MDNQFLDDDFRNFLQEEAKTEAQTERCATEYNEPPKPLESPDLGDLTAIRTKYLTATVSEDNFAASDYLEDKILEIAMQSIFGEDVWNWIYSQMEGME